MEKYSDNKDSFASYGSYKLQRLSGNNTNQSINSSANSSYLNFSNIPMTVSINSNLFIEQLNETNTEELFTLTDRNRLYLRKWLPWLDYCTKKIDTLNFIKSTKAGISESSNLTYGIFYRKEITGTISFNKILWSDKRAEIGYWIGEEFQGLGLVTSACSEIIDIGFEKIGLEEIWISCAWNNKKSQNIPIRLGFTENKLISKRENLYGNYIDNIIYIITKNDWIHQKNKQ